MRADRSSGRFFPSLLSRRNRRPASLLVDYGEGLRILPTPFIRAWAAAGLAGASLIPFVSSGFVVHLLNLTWIAVVAAIAINLLTGLAGLVSLGHAAFLAVGAFTAAELATTWGMPAWLTLVGAGLAGGLVGLLIGLPSLRLKALYVAVTTFALHFAVVLGASVWQGRAAAYSGITMPNPVLPGGVPLRSPFSWYFPLLGLALAAMLLSANLRRTRLGRAWIALHDREVAAETLGINLVKAKVSVFVLSSAVTGVAGAVAGYYSGVVSSESYTIGLAISYLAMIIIGGLGRLLGAVLGAFFVTWLPFLVEEGTRLTGLEVGPGKIGGLQTAVFAVVIIIFILYEPGGLAAIWDRFRNFVALWPFRVLPLQQSRR
jgi:branched-chain amino acid transport system permease protein